MDDRFLHDIRREPPARFTRKLRLSLIDMEQRPAWWRFGPTATRWASAAASIAFVAVAFSLPSVRAGAAQFLNLFRVVNVAAISVDLSGLENVSFEGIDIAAMIGEEDFVASEGGSPISYGSMEDAEAAAGYTVREPTWLPAGWNRTSIEVTGEHAFQLTARTALLELVLEQLQITDLTVPSNLEGAQVSVEIPPVTRTSYDDGDLSVSLLQAPTPEMVLPGDVEPATIAEIGLRIMGLDRDTAYNLAWTVDWRSTLLIPVPAQEASFDKVKVRGSDGVMVLPRNGSGQALLMWATDDRVFALAREAGSGLDPSQLLIMAESIL